MSSDFEQQIPCGHPENFSSKSAENLKAKSLSIVQQLLVKQGAVIVAHFYTNATIQHLAQATGGMVGDSLEMAAFGQRTTASTLLVVGVRFMGETAKILNPEKRVLVPTREADCSLDSCCTAEDFAQFKQDHPERVAVVYANTSAAVKAQADWVVTSSIAVPLVDHLHHQGKKILWATDRYLGDYVRRKTGADLVSWPGSCVVHEQFDAQRLLQLKQLYPNAAVLVHPESPAAVIELADVVGSTAQLLAASAQLPQELMIIATDEGIIYQMQLRSPHKRFLVAPTQTMNRPCHNCAICPWMAMNSVDGILRSLREEVDEILLPPELIQQAAVPLKKMLAFRTHNL